MTPVAPLGRCEIKRSCLHHVFGANLDRVSGVIHENRWHRPWEKSWNPRLFVRAQMCEKAYCARAQPKEHPERDTEEPKRDVRAFIAPRLVSGSV